MIALTFGCDAWTLLLTQEKFALTKWGKKSEKTDNCMMMINLREGGRMGRNQVSVLLRTNMSEAIKRKQLNSVYPLALTGIGRK